MARIQTFDHCGFVVEDIPRAHKFYGQLFGAKPLHIANLNTSRAYSGWAIISFVEMGGHRFELCLAQHPLPPVSEDHKLPAIGFAVTEETMEQLISLLQDTHVAFEGPFTYANPIPLNQAIRVRDPDGNVLEFAVRSE